MTRRLLRIQVRNQLNRAQAAFELGSVLLSHSKIAIASDLGTLGWDPCYFPNPFSARGSAAINAVHLYVKPIICVMRDQAAL